MPLCAPFQQQFVPSYFPPALAHGRGMVTFWDEGAEWRLCRLCALLPAGGREAPGDMQCAAWAFAPPAWADSMSEGDGNYSQCHHTACKS